jgi:hypothetical protein
VISLPDPDLGEQSVAGEAIRVGKDQQGRFAHRAQSLQRERFAVKARELEGRSRSADRQARFRFGPDLLWSRRDPSDVETSLQGLDPQEQPSVLPDEVEKEQGRGCEQADDQREAGKARELNGAAVGEPG